MTVVHSAHTVATTPTLIATIPAGNPTTTVYIYNNDNSSIYIGDVTVASSGTNLGLTIVKNTVFAIELNATDKLYAVSSAGTASNAVVVMHSEVLP